jgi:acyl transferase domain-containing protein/acyl carrier protein
MKIGKLAHPKLPGSAGVPSSPTRRSDQDTLLRSVYDAEQVNVAILNIVQSMLGTDVITSAPLLDSGLDSLGAVELREEINAAFCIELPSTAVFDYPTIDSLTNLITAEMSKRKEETRLNDIDAFGCASSLDSGLQTLPTDFRPLASLETASSRLARGAEWTSGARDVIARVVIDRWLVDDSTKQQSRFGSFLCHIDAFDPDAFNISTAESALIDPQHRMLLEAVWTIKAAVQTTPSEYAGVIVGISGNEYSRIIDHISPYTATGGALSVACGRLSYAFGLQGVCLSIDTACSSSLVGTHVALKSIASGESKSVSACGVNVTLSALTTALFTKAGMLAHDGRCKTLDASADGYVRGEACVTLELRLVCTSTESDQGSICASAVNQDGRSSSLTAPNGPSQQRALRAALRVAGRHGGTMAGLELHGTGTPLGDPIEVGAAHAVLIENVEEIRCSSPILSGMKPFTGHTEPAAGVVGIVNAIHQIGKQAARFIIHLQRLNPHLLTVSSAQKHTKTAFRFSYPRLDSPAAVAAARRSIAIGVSAFAFQGTNAHAVINKGSSADLPYAFCTKDIQAVTFDKSRHWVCNRSHLLSRASIDFVPYNDAAFICFSFFKSSDLFCSLQAIKDILPFFESCKNQSNTAYLSSIVFLGVIDFAVVKAHLDGDFTSFHVDINLIDGSVVLRHGLTTLLICCIVDCTLVPCVDLYPPTLPCLLHNARNADRIVCVMLRTIVEVKDPSTFSVVLSTKRCLTLSRLSAIKCHWENVFGRHSSSFNGNISSASIRSCQGFCQNNNRIMHRSCELILSPIITSGVISSEHLNKLNVNENSPSTQSSENDLLDSRYLVSWMANSSLHPNSMTGRGKQPKSQNQTSASLFDRNIGCRIAASIISEAQAICHSSYSQLGAALLTTRNALTTAPRSGFCAQGDIGCSSAWGILRVVGNENRGRISCGFDADFSSANTPSGLVQADSSSGTSIRCGIIYVGSIQKVERSNRDVQHLRRACIKFKGNILITGGLGAICNILITWITTLCASTERGALEIVVSGRCGRAKHFHKWASQTCLITARKCDIASSEDHSLISIHACDNGQIGTIMHTSGVLLDALIPNQTPTIISKVSAPKVAGLKSMQNFLLETSAVQKCLIFSSIASSLGSPGQANYAAANAWMDGWAASARHTSIGGIVTSIQWGPWTDLPDGGMACKIQSSNAAKKTNFIGVGLLSPKNGIQITEMILKYCSSYDSTAAVTLAAKFSWGILLSAVEGAKSTAFFSSVASRVPRRKRANGPADDVSALSLMTSSDAASPLSSHVHPYEHSTQSIILATIARVLGHEVDPEKPLIDAGVDSLSMAELGRQIEIDIKVPLPSTALFDYPTVADLSAYVINQIGSLKSNLQRPYLSKQATLSTHKCIHSERVAVVGTGMRFAGPGPDAVDSFEKFWQVLASGSDGVRIVPLSRWDIDVDTTSFGIRRRRDPEIEEYSRHGSFITGIDSFDCRMFGVDTNASALIDPQQRMLLKVVVDAMHAGYLDSRHARGSNTAVFVGICNNDKDTVLREHVIELAMGGSSYNDIVDTVGIIAYSTYAFASNRISYILGLIGTSISIDCASASALVAVHVAANEVKRELNFNLRCLASSVNLILHHNLTDLHTARNMFPKDGRSKTFDASADGFERGEGVGATLLRNSMEMDGEVSIVYIAGSVSIHKGGGASLRALRGPAIQLKVHRALETASMEPNDVKYIEASGLGEPYGDAVEVSAYQNVFEPERISNDRLIFGSVHTNIGHLDGCSGIASFLKACAVSFHASAPPLVHFKTLHALMRGKSSADTAALLGHTFHSTDILTFPSAFPMSLLPAYSQNIKEACGAGITCADGLPKLISAVSSFGFGGTMVNVILDVGNICLRHFSTYSQLDYAELVIPRIDHRNHCDLQTLSEESLAYIESIVWKSIREVIGPSRTLARDTLLIQTNDSKSLDLIEYRLFKEVLTERLGVKFLPSSVFSNCATVAHVSHGILVFILRSQIGATYGMNIGSIIKAWLKTHSRRQCADPCRLPLSMTIVPSRQSLRQIAFVLASPRSGSTLTQLILNANPRVFAPQELYLLHFHTMEERRLRLSGQDLEGWIFEGLRKAVMELRYCDSRAASETLTVFETLDTQQVYHILQGWADGRILVDKTPPYIWSKDTLQRAESIFHDVRYIFICRHPYANIFSMTKETIRRDWLGVALDGLVRNKSHHLDSHSKAQERKLDLQTNVECALWEEAEDLWAIGNGNVLDFLTRITSERKLKLSYESIVQHPETTSRALCSMLEIPFSPDMLFPFTDVNTSTFAPAFKGGLGAGDPHMLSRRGIHSHFASTWQRTSLPQLLSPFTSHVAKRLGYSLPAWKHTILRSDIPVDVVRLNSSTKEPAIIFIHDHTGDVHYLRSLATELTAAAFCIRALACDMSNIDMNAKGQSQHKSSSFIYDKDVQSLAARYRSIISSTLEFVKGDRVVYGGIGSFGMRVAFEMAAQQHDATIYDNNTSGASMNGWISRTYQSNNGEHSAIALLLFAGRDAFEVNDKLPLDTQALHSAKLTLDTTFMTGLSKQEVNTALLGVPITCLEALRQESTTTHGKINGHQLDCLHSVERALNVTHRGLQLAEIYVSPLRTFDYPIIHICGQGPSRNVRAEVHGTKDELLKISCKESLINLMIQKMVNKFSSL